ncbi:MAG: glycoside hydrolase family 3 [Caldilineaceae bacterium]|nr:glycoside hydrolase family 3 [Caldilineaceae bacterium]
MPRPKSYYPSISRRRFLRQGSALLGLLAGGAWTRPGLAKEGLPPLPAASIRPSLAAPLPPLDVKIGQMLMAGFRGLTLEESPVLQANLRDERIGSVVLFDRDVALGSGRRNIASPEQVRHLVDQIQAAAVTPLLIAADEEGGQVNRLKEAYGFPATVSPAYLGVMNDLEKTDAAADSIARTMAELGINLNLAPVVDVNVNPNNPVIGSLGRSISHDPATVAAHAEQFIAAHHRHGVMCTLKHFPGHGSSRGDTHYGFVDVTETWTEEELIPFRKIIADGMADAVMTAHIFNATLDANLPATLSHNIITGLLREEMGYDGVIISDDMQMGAISNYYAFDEAVQVAVLAGVDIIALSNNIRFARNLPEQAHSAIRRMVEEGKISEARIDQSYRRVMALKERIALA